MSIQLERSDCGGNLREAKLMRNRDFPPKFLLLALRSSDLTDYIY